MLFQITNLYNSFYEKTEFIIHRNKKLNSTFSYIYNFNASLKIIIFHFFTPYFIEAYTVTGRECALPFIYKGVSYPDATDVDNNGVKWCSLTPNYDVHKKWQVHKTTKCPGIQFNLFYFLVKFTDLWKFQPQYLLYTLVAAF